MMTARIYTFLHACNYFIVMLNCKVYGDFLVCGIPFVEMAVFKPGYAEWEADPLLSELSLTDKVCINVTSGSDFV